MKATPGVFLEKINQAGDIKRLPKEDLGKLCKDIRHFIIDTVSLFGGHLGASLGVTEITVALHYLFDFEQDTIVWDVGHQAYGHKILTGRRDNFHLNRKLNGLSGFPSRAESPYDFFGTGHSSTSVSAALGFALADKLRGKNGRHIALIGDGSLSSGMAFEALNNAGDPKFSDLNVLIIVNDNGISIDPSTGALHTHLQEITKSRENIFENLNLPYYGPIDGHDLPALLETLQLLSEKPGVKILHCRTKKGKGYDAAENDQVGWHAPGTFNKVSGKLNQAEAERLQPYKFQDVFGKTLLELARQNPDIVAVTPAMPSGSSLRLMMEEMPDRAFDVGIAEQHAVTFAAGAAAAGLLPFCSLYSTFLQRGYDQIVHDVCLQNLKVIFPVDRAGFVGEDGATHQGVYDLAALRCLPNARIAAPMDEIELRQMLYTAALPAEEGGPDGPFFIRYPRGRGKISEPFVPFEKIPLDKGRQLCEGSDLAVLSFGEIGNRAAAACRAVRAEGFSPAHFDMRFAKPLDFKLLDEIFKNYLAVLTVEESALAGGFGSAVTEYAAEKQADLLIYRAGIPDRIMEQAKAEEQSRLCGLDQIGLARKISAVFREING